MYSQHQQVPGDNGQSVPVIDKSAATTANVTAVSAATDSPECSTSLRQDDTDANQQSLHSDSKSINDLHTNTTTAEDSRHSGSDTTILDDLQGTSGIKPAELDLDQAGQNVDNLSLSASNLEPLYEVALDSFGEEQLAAQRKASRSRRPNTFKSLRFFVVAIALVSSFTVNYSKTIINYAILDMIDVTKNTNSTTTTTTTTKLPPRFSSLVFFDENENRDQPFDKDNSCPVTSPEERERLINELNSDKRRAKTPGEKFKWEPWQEELLKSAYSVGHIPLMILGSRMSEIHGPHSVMTLTAIGMSLCCLFAPALAALSFWTFLIDLGALGALGGFMTPAMITVFSNWLTPNERSICISLYLVTSRLGSGLSSYISGTFRQQAISWRYVFISASSVSLAFGAAFFFLATNKPVEHPRISAQELEYLASKNRLVRESLASQRQDQIEMDSLDGDGASSSKKSEKAAISVTNNQKPATSAKTKAPWLKIISNGPVWAFIVTKLCVKITGDLPANELPTYLNRVMHIPDQRSKWIMPINYVIFSVGSFTSGILASKLNKKQPFNLNKTMIRKIFQSIASFGVGISLIGIAFSTCDEITTYVLVGIMFFVTTLGTAGEAQMATDLSERYSGTLHALASTVGSNSGWIVGSFVGMMRSGDHANDKDIWRKVWTGGAVVSCIGGAVFMLFADGKVQSFDKQPSDELEAPAIPGGDHIVGPSTSNGPNESGIFELVAPPPYSPLDRVHLELSATGGSLGLLRKPSTMSDIPEDENEERPYRESRMI